MQFAEGYERDTDRPNLILFPSDVKWRRELYPEGVFEHEGKMQMHIVKACVEYFKHQGVLPDNGRILDPFGGTGTTALAATLGPYHVTLVELEQAFLDILIKLRNFWLDQRSGSVTVLAGDCRQILSQLQANSFDMVLTSPPYQNLKVGKEVTEFTGSLALKKSRYRKYGSDEAHVLNFGRLNSFVFNQQMQKVYQEVARLLKPTGVYVSVTKDSMRAGVRHLLSMEVVRQAQASGLEYTGEWFKWKPPGSMLQVVMKAKGSEVVQDEDIIVFRKATQHGR